MGSLHNLTPEHVPGLLQPAPLELWARHSQEAEALWLCLPLQGEGWPSCLWRRLCSARAAQEFNDLTSACPTLQGAVLLEISEAPGAGTSGFEKGTNSRVQVLLNNEPLEGELCCDLTA